MNAGAGAILLQAQPTGGPDFSFFLMIGALLVIWYLLLIRPQAKQRREHEEMLKAIEKGDQVVTSGGLHGRVTGVADDVLTLEIAALKGERVRVKVSRARVDSVQKAKGGEES